MPEATGKKHILLVVYGLTQGRGGTERLGAELASYLAERGHRVTILVQDAEERPPAYALDARVDVVRAQLIDTSASRSALRQSLVRLAPDVCAAFFSWEAMAQWPVLLHGTGIPLILSERSSPHVIETERWNRPDRLTALSGADGIHVLLDAYRASLPPHLQAKTSVIPNGVALPAVMPPCAGREPHMVGMGRLIPGKGYALLIEAFALLAESFPRWKLTVWGEGPERERLEARIHELGLQSRVFLPGVTQNPPAVLAKAALFCHPSVQEGFPHAVLEACAAALPVVGYARCPGMRELVPSGVGLLVQENSPQAWAEALRPLLREEGLRADMGRAAFAHARTFAQADVFAQWERLLVQHAACKGNTVLDTPLPEDPEAQLRRRLEALLSLEQLHSSHPRQPRLPLDMFPVPGCDPRHYPPAPEEAPGPDFRLYTLAGMEDCFLKVCAKLIEDSGLFDEDWYRRTYVRGREEVMPPIEHYLRLGAAKGYEPHAAFRGAWYRQQHMARFEDALNPLVHYILYGKEQPAASPGSPTAASADQAAASATPANPLTASPAAPVAPTVSSAVPPAIPLERE